MSKFTRISSTVHLNTWLDQYYNLSKTETRKPSTNFFNLHLFPDFTATFPTLLWTSSSDHLSGNVGLYRIKPWSADTSTR